MQAKKSGISVLIAMGTSMLVLTLAFATLDSIGRSLEQAINIQRSTKLFFASESGIEAAFFHHNSRGAGLNFNSDHASQTIDHSSILAEAQWSIVGRTDESIGSNPILGNILKEAQSIQISLAWDSSTNPTQIPNESGKPDVSDEIQIDFFNTTSDLPASSAKTQLIAEHGSIVIDNGFNFGDDGDDDNSDGDNGTDGDEVLIDWSFSRKNSIKGVQTFIPTENEDCINGAAVDGFICENQLLGGTKSILTSNPIVGKILPGGTVTDLSQFWDCNDPGTAGTCSDYKITFRSLLKLEDTSSSKKIPGIPFVVKLISNSTTSFPKSFYTVVADVSQEKFSQQISIDVPERSSIGAFDYVIFD